MEKASLVRMMRVCSMTYGPGPPIHLAHACICAAGDPIPSQPWHDDGDDGEADIQISGGLEQRWIMLGAASLF